MLSMRNPYCSPAIWKPRGGGYGGPSDPFILLTLVSHLWSLVSDLEKPTNKQTAQHRPDWNFKKLGKINFFNVVYNQISDPRKDDLIIDVKTKDLEILSVVCIHSSRTTPRREMEIKKWMGGWLGITCKFSSSLCPCLVQRPIGKTQSEKLCIASTL